MAENTTQSTFDSLKAEVDSLRSEFEKIVKEANAKGKDTASDLASKIAEEIHSYSHKAAVQADRLREAGAAGFNEVGQHVRQNPVASLLIAFGLGCVVSCIFRHLR